MSAWVQSNFSADSDGNGKQIWLRNIWLGVSVENQNYTWRIKHLQSTPAHVRDLSIVWHITHRCHKRELLLKFTPDQR
jgi:hypothetical protein